MLQVQLEGAQKMTSIDEAVKLSGDVLMEYDSQEHYEVLTGRLGMLREWKVRFFKNGASGLICSRSLTVPTSPCNLLMISV